MFYPVIMAGGSGTRLWPLSRSNFPKQCIDLFDTGSLIEKTYERISNIYPDEKIFISTNIKYISLLQDLLPISKQNYIIEPTRKDTAAAIGLLTMIINSIDPDSNIITLASDHFIQDTNLFQKTILYAQNLVEKYTNNLITIGIKPNYPETGYGYIEKGNVFIKEEDIQVFKVKSFKEKPNIETATNFVLSNNYLWNAGIFVFNTSYMIELYKKYLPKTYEILSNIVKNKDNENFEKILNEQYVLLPENISFDIAIVEKLSDILVIQGDFGWSDIGNWKSLKDNLSKNEENLIIGKSINIDTNGCLIYNKNKEKIIATIGIKNLAIIDTNDALLISDLNQSQDVKKIYEKLEQDYK